MAQKLRFERRLPGERKEKESQASCEGASTMTRQVREIKARLWLRRIAKGDMRAFNRLYDAFEHPLLGFLNGILGNSHDAEDVFQDVMVEIWNRAAQRYKGGSPSCYIFGIAYNKAMTSFRGQRDLRPIDKDDLMDSAKCQESRVIEIDLIKKALAVLCMIERLILILSHVEGIPYRKIGDILEMPEGTVKRKMSEIRAKLREFGCEEEDNEEGDNGDDDDD